MLYKQILLGFFVILQLISGELFFLTLGYLILSFPDIEFHIRSQYFGTLIVLLLISQAILAGAVWSDFKQRCWSDENKRALWAKIFSFGCFNYGYAIFNIIYYLTIIKDKMESGWWDNEKKRSQLFSKITKKRVLNIMSIINIAAVPIFFLALALIFIGGGLNSDFIGLLGFKLGAIWMIAIVNIGGLFQFLVMIHMVSKKWDDYSFENYFTAKIIFLPVVSLRDYYNKIAYKDLDE